MFGFIIVKIMEAPRPGIEPGNPEGNEFSRLAHYHCAIWADNNKISLYLSLKKYNINLTEQ